MNKMKLNIQMFGSTNKTTNYELPQWVGSDKPSYLTDFNSAFNTIDTAMHNNAEASAQATSDVADLTDRVETAESTVSSLDTRVDTVEATVQSASTTATNAQQTASSALSTANTANGKADTNASNISTLSTTVGNNTTAISGLDTRLDTVEADIDKFNLSNVTTSSLTKASGTFTIASGSTLKVATNSDGSIAKIYGQISANNVTTNGVVVATSPLRPSEDITIDGASIKANMVNGTVKTIGWGSYTIKTNGNIEFPMSWAVSGGETCRHMAIACLIFVKDFGDTPVPNGD